jgi:isopenicillin-N epimerase
VKEIIEKARALGLITIIDGAHVPGHIDLNITELNPDYYTGTLHKWMLSPKGCSFLYVRKEWQDIVDPLVVGWGYQSESPGKSRFLDYHEFQGTRDIAAFLSAPTAIQFLKENNWKEKSAQSKKIILNHYKIFCELLDSEPICPITNEFLGQMCSIPIRTEKPTELKETLYHQYNIEIPVMKIDQGTFLRISYNGYNNEDDIGTLKNALVKIKASTNLFV